MLLSILTPTLIERRERFQALRDKIIRQIQESPYKAQVEHLIFEDNREHSIGHKRNDLLERACGQFVVFVDDDDDVNDHYVALICEAIETHPEVDCVGIRGRITFNGSHPHDFVHSLQYRRYFKKHGIYYRPPLHINPIRRKIADRYKFEDISYSEDIDWAMRIVRDRVLKKEHLISQSLYSYETRRQWWYQWLIDNTETFRQVLGLQLVNRIRMRRWLREHL